MTVSIVLLAGMPTMMATIMLSERFGVDMSGYDLDGPIPDMPKADTYHSFTGVMLAKAKREQMTLRDLYNLVAAARGHWVLCGSAESIAACGGNPARLREGTALRDPKAMGAYLEVHIEQAPQLIEAGAPLAVCLANPGNVRHPFIRITGEDAHTGLPHRFRRDAALAGADFSLALEQLWLAEEAAGRPMAVTIGRFHTPATKHSLTAVSGDFEMSLDLRGYSAAHLAALEGELQRIAAEVAARRGVSIVLGERSAAAPVTLDFGAVHYVIPSHFGFCLG
eukprot:gene51679-63182_t